MSEIKWYGEEFLAKTREQAKQALMKAAIVVEADAKKKCPVDTGRLRSSITHEFSWQYSELDELVTRVGTNVNYAHYVEFGTYKDFERGIRKMAARPYLRPAIEENRATIAGYFR